MQMAKSPMINATLIAAAVPSHSKTIAKTRRGELRFGGADRASGAG